MDVIVTTPKQQMKKSAQEAENCLKNGGGSYFRRFPRLPKGLVSGSKIFYVEDGFIRGYGVVARVESGNKTCGTHGTSWGSGFYAVIPADSWKWIRPIPMKGFQGFRYFNQSHEVVGDWKDKKPEVPTNIITHSLTKEDIKARKIPPIKIPIPNKKTGSLL